MVGQRRAHYNTKAQLRALEALIAKLPDPATPVVPRKPRPTPKRATRLAPDEVRKMIIEYQAGATVYELGNRFGVSRQRVAEILKRHGVKMRRQGLAPAQIDEAVRLYKDGWSLARIGNHLDVNAGTVRTRLMERGVRMRDPQGQQR